MKHLTTLLLGIALLTALAISDAQAQPTAEISIKFESLTDPVTGGLHKPVVSRFRPAGSQIWTNVVPDTWVLISTLVGGNWDVEVTYSSAADRARDYREEETVHFKTRVTIEGTTYEEMICSIGSVALPGEERCSGMSANAIQSLIEVEDGWRVSVNTTVAYQSVWGPVTVPRASLGGGGSTYRSDSSFQLRTEPSNDCHFCLGNNCLNGICIERNPLWKR